jgi:hypothetical protein
LAVSSCPDGVGGEFATRAHDAAGNRLETDHLLERCLGDAIGIVGDLGVVVAADVDVVPLAGGEGVQREEEVDLGRPLGVRRLGIGLEDRFNLAVDVVAALFEAAGDDDVVAGFVAVPGVLVHQELAHLAHLGDAEAVAPDRAVLAFQLAAVKNLSRIFEAVGIF